MCLGEQIADDKQFVAAFQTRRYGAPRGQPLTLPSDPLPTLSAQISQVYTDKSIRWVTRSSKSGVSSQVVWAGIRDSGDSAVFWTQIRAALPVGWFVFVVENYRYKGYCRRRYKEVMSYYYYYVNHSDKRGIKVAWKITIID